MHTATNPDDIDRADPITRQSDVSIYQLNRRIIAYTLRRGRREQSAFGCATQRRHVAQPSFSNRVHIRLGLGRSRSDRRIEPSEYPGRKDEPRIENRAAALARNDVITSGQIVQHDKWHDLAYTAHQTDDHVWIGDLDAIERTIEEAELRLPPVR